MGGTRMGTRQELNVQRIFQILEGKCVIASSILE